MREKFSDEKDKARRAIQVAIKNGWYKRPPCEGCGSVNSVDAYHEDYSEPYSVLWLCRPCRAAHGKNELILNGPKAPPIDTAKPCHECQTPVPRKNMTGLRPNTPVLCEKCKETVRFCAICHEVKSVYDFSPKERRCKPCNAKRAREMMARKRG